MFSKTASLFAILSALAFTNATPVDDRYADPDNAIQLNMQEWAACHSLIGGGDRQWGYYGPGEWDFFFDGAGFNKLHFNCYIYTPNEKDDPEWETWSNAELVQPEDYANKASEKFDCIIECNDNQICTGKLAFDRTISGDSKNVKTAECTKINK